MYFPFPVYIGLIFSIYYCKSIIFLYYFLGSEIFVAVNMLMQGEMNGSLTFK